MKSILHVIFGSMFVLQAPIAEAQHGDGASQGYSSVVVENCYSDRVAVRVWASANGGVWRDLGLVESQWSGDDCPARGEPLTFELEGGATWVIRAIDSRCGTSSPRDSLARCHVLKTPPLTGSRTRASSYTARVGGQR